MEWRVMVLEDGVQAVFLQDQSGKIASQRQIYIIYLYLHLSICISIHLSIYHLSLCICLYLSTSLSFSLFLFITIYLNESINLSHHILIQNFQCSVATHQEEIWVPTGTKLRVVSSGKSCYRI